MMSRQINGRVCVSVCVCAYRGYFNRNSSCKEVHLFTQSEDDDATFLNEVHICIFMNV